MCENTFGRVVTRVIPRHDFIFLQMKWVEWLWGSRSNCTREPVRLAFPLSGGAADLAPIHRSTHSILISSNAGESRELQPLRKYLCIFSCCIGSWPPHRKSRLHTASSSWQTRGPNMRMNPSDNGYLNNNFPFGLSDALLHRLGCGLPKERHWWARHGHYLIPAMSGKHETSS